MSEISAETARHNMIEQQIRPWDVLDDTVLNLIADVPREEFVPAGFHNLAFADMNIPLGHGEAMMSPKLEARMLQALDVKPTETVLEIGTGSGYVTALLAKLARHVYSVDIHEDFVNHAHSKLNDDDVVNVTLEQGDAATGWAQHGPYDVIAVTGSLPLLPDSLRESLKMAGRLFVIEGDSPVMTARLITRLSDNEFHQDFHSENLFETDLPPLRNAVQPDRFVL